MGLLDAVADWLLRHQANRPPPAPVEHPPLLEGRPKGHVSKEAVAEMRGAMQTKRAIEAQLWAEAEEARQRRGRS
jgi:hypothetical protein